MLDLEKKYIELIKKMLARHVPDKAVWVYGSRIKGTAHAGSDLDLVVMDSSESIQHHKSSYRLYEHRFQKAIYLF